MFCVLFAAWWTHYLDSVSAAEPGQLPLSLLIFRTKLLLRECCSATCQRRRRPGQLRRGQGGLQITAVLLGIPIVRLVICIAPEWAIWAPVQGGLGLRCGRVGGRHVMLSCLRVRCRAGG